MRWPPASNTNWSDVAVSTTTNLIQVTLDALNGGGVIPLWFVSVIRKVAGWLEAGSNQPFACKPALLGETKQSCVNNRKYYTLSR